MEVMHKVTENYKSKEKHITFHSVDPEGARMIQKTEGLLQMEYEKGEAIK
eukprot:gene7039-22848_t